MALYWIFGRSLWKIQKGYHETSKVLKRSTVVSAPSLAAALISSSSFCSVMLNYNSCLQVWRQIILASCIWLPERRVSGGGGLKKGLEWEFLGRGETEWSGRRGRRERGLLATCGLHNQGTNHGGTWQSEWQMNNASILQPPVNRPIHHGRGD